jgi:histone H3/H4
VVETNGKKYKVLLAAATYFKIEPGDEVTLVVPRDTESIWGAIENVLRKAEDIEKESHRKTFNSDFSHLMEKEQEPEKKENESYEEEKIPLSAVEKLAKEIEEERKRIQKKNDSILDEWTPDLEEIKKEASYPARNFDE